MITDEDSFILQLDTINSMSLIKSMLDDLSYNFFMKSIGYVEHIVAVTLPSLWVLVREIIGHYWQCDQVIVEALH